MFEALFLVGIFVLVAALYLTNLHNCETRDQQNELIDSLRKEVCFLPKKHRRDTEMLDWLQDQLDRKQYTGKCIFRWSSTERGFRLHETTLSGAVSNVREAITNEMTRELADDKSGES